MFFKKKNLISLFFEVPKRLEVQTPPSMLNSKSQVQLPMKYNFPKEMRELQVMRDMHREEES